MGDLIDLGRARAVRRQMQELGTTETPNATLTFSNMTVTGGTVEIEGTVFTCHMSPVSPQQLALNLSGRPGYSY